MTDDQVEGGVGAYAHVMADASLDLMSLRLPAAGPGADATGDRPAGGHGRTRAALFIADLCAMWLLGMVSGTALAPALGIAWPVAVGFVASLVVTLLVAYPLVGMYAVWLPADRREPVLVVLVHFVAGVAWAVATVVGGAPSAAPLVAIAAVLSAAGVLSARRLARLWGSRRALWGASVAVMGQQDAAEAWMMRHASAFPDCRFVVVSGLPVAVEGTSRPAAPGSQRDAIFKRTPGLQHVVLCVSAVNTESLLAASRYLDAGLRTVRVVAVAPADGRTAQGGGLSKPDLGVLLTRGLQERRTRHLKRAFDLLLLVPAAVVAAPLVALAAVAVRWVSPGVSPFYAQKREGRGGRMIRVWKLRTMHPHADRLLERHLEASPEARREWETSFKLRHDPRVLPVVGTLLRKTSLDELPQLWNIALGEMSFIGPRPFPEYHLSAFDEGFRALRRKATPGLTGLWQVSGRADGDLEFQRDLDSHYVVCWSFWLDVWLLLRTPWAVLGGRGAY